MFCKRMLAVGCAVATLCFVLHGAFAFRAAAAEPALAAGRYFSLALNEDGEVLSWGDNEYGLLGYDPSEAPRLGSYYASAAPTVITALSGKTVIAIETGNEHGLALTSEGEVYSWGVNVYGQLGYEQEDYSVVPGLVNGLSGKAITAVAAGYYQTLALTSGGQVYSWGYNSYGQLGYATTSYSYNVEPKLITDFPAGAVIKDITAGDAFCLALTAGGRVYAWGLNGHGRLGAEISTTTTVPVETDLPASVSIKAIAAGAEFALALTTGGQVYSWGNNANGQLGFDIAKASSYTKVPTLISALSGKTVTAIAAGYDHSMALTDEGQVYSWGRNSSGQLGNGTSADSSTPVLVDSLTGVNYIAAGGLQSFAIQEDNTVFAWGYNNRGQRGDGTTTDAFTPVVVKGEELSLSSSYSQQEVKNAVSAAVTVWDPNGDGRVDLADIIKALQIIAEAG